MKTSDILSTASAFNPALFHFDGMYLVYGTGQYTTDTRFVARFKYAAQRRRRRKFTAFLIKHFTPAEYFGRIAAGESPMTIVESKGYTEQRNHPVPAVTPTPGTERVLVRVKLPDGRRTTHDFRTTSAAVLDVEVGQALQRLGSHPVVTDHRVERF